MALKIYFCKRSAAQWKGGLLICAENETQAKAFYNKYEETQEDPYRITEIDIQDGVIYDDYER